MTQPTTTRWDVLAHRLPRYAVLAFAVMVLLTGVLAVVVHRVHFGADRNYGFLDGPVWLDTLFQGDSGWYHAIADQGYSYTVGQQSSIAFFPAYPLAVVAVGMLVGEDWSTAQGIVTLLAGAGMVALFADWARRRMPARTAVVAVGVLLVYPYSFFLYGTGYSDAFFMLSALGAFALLERRHYVLAGLVGVLATGGRPVGVAVLAGLTVRALELLAEQREQARAAQPALAMAGGAPPPAEGGGTVRGLAGNAGNGPDARPLPWRSLLAALPLVRGRELALLVSGTGLVGWMVYLGVRFGDPLAFVTVQGAPGWEQAGGPATWFKLMFAGAIAKGLWGTVALLVPQALACVLAVLLLRVVWQRFGWGYAAYAFVSLAIPIIGTKDFMGSGRYVMAAFPVLAAAAVVLTGERRPRWVLPGAFAVMAVGLVLGTVCYVVGVSVS